MTTRLPIYPTASKLSLALRCAYPWTSGLAWPAQETGVAALLGTAGHTAAEMIVDGTEPDLDAIAAETGLGKPERVALAGIVAQMRAVLRALPNDLDVRVGAEVAIAYDPATNTARLLETAGARDYSGARTGELVGTADLVVREGDGRTIILDWKTGRGARQTRVGETAQMRFLGLAFARLYGLESIAIQLAHCDEHEHWVDSATLDAWELDAIAAEMRALSATLAAAPTPAPGEHCAGMYCPLLSECPTTRAALAEASGAETTPAFPLSVEIQSAEHAAYTLTRIAGAKALLDKVERALKDYATTNGPIDLGNGRAWGPVQQDGRESIDLSVAGAEELLRERLGEMASAAIELSTSKEALKRATGSAKLQKALLEELRALGAIKVGAPWVKWSEFARAAS